MKRSVSFLGYELQHPINWNTYWDTIVYSIYNFSLESNTIDDGKNDFLFRLGDLFCSPTKLKIFLWRIYMRKSSIQVCKDKESERERVCVCEYDPIRMNALQCTLTTSALHVSALRWECLTFRILVLSHLWYFRKVDFQINLILHFSVRNFYGKVYPVN